MHDFARALREQDVDPSPFRQFETWFAEAATAGIREPTAAALATATSAAEPSVRMVLVKSSGEDGFAFYTNYESRKGRELAENPSAAMLFHWDALGRQVRIEGTVERMAPADSASYIRTRPRGSQLSALASPQSRPIAAREELERRVADLARRYRDSELPLPGDWGGFRLVAHRFEFWQHREDRLHDRLAYVRGDDGLWTVQRLAP